MEESFAGQCQPAQQTRSSPSTLGGGCCHPRSCELLNEVLEDGLRAAPGNEQPGGGLAARGLVSPAAPCSRPSRVSCCSWFQLLAVFLVSSRCFKQKGAWKGGGWGPGWICPSSTPKGIVECGIWSRQKLAKDMKLGEAVKTRSKFKLAWTNRRSLKAKRMLCSRGAASYLPSSGVINA